MNKFSRLLNDQDQVEHFLKEVLALDYSVLHELSYGIISSGYAVHLTLVSLLKKKLL